MAGFNHGHGHGHDHLYSNITGLNGIPSDYEIALQQQQASHYDFQADLDMFTNTQFFDFDMAEMPETASPSTGSSDRDAWNIDTKFVDQRQQPSIPEFNNYRQQPQRPHQPLNHNANNQHRPFPRPSYTSHSALSTTNTSSPSAVSSPPTSGPRQKSESTTTSTETVLPHALEEASRAAAEEDKRRRNTAASARFRVKKKQREQALEKSAKEMTDRVTYLENRVATLEMENKLLKDLITEKKGTDADGLLEAKKQSKIAEAKALHELEPTVSAPEQKQQQLGKDDAKRKTIAVKPAENR